MALALALVAMNAACGGGGGGSPPPPPPPPVSVTVAPATQSVLLGATQQFTATVTNASSTAVTWSVNGISGGNATLGTIDANGLYRGPSILPSPASVTIRATSVASPASFGSASVTVTSDVVVSITAPAQNASVELGAPQQATAAITSTGNGADPSVNWSVSGNGCAGAECGTINLVSGLFTAPGILPPTPNRDVTVTATSVADPSKFATLTLRIVANFTFSIIGPAGNTIDNAKSFQFVTIFSPVPGSNPSTAVNWSVSGPGCAGTACGTIDQTGLYTAPNLAPSPPQITITAIAVADTSKGQTTPAITINSIILVAISPASLNMEIEEQQNFTANVGGTQNQDVTWSISGVGCGNPGNPCGSISNPGPVVGSIPVIYTAPITIPSTAITITATSVADITKTASVTPTFFSTIQPSLTPSGATRAVNHRQTLDAVLVRTSTGTAPVANAVEWRVNGVLGGDTIVGQICTQALDGTPCTQTAVTQSGAPATPFKVDYLAPAVVPAGSVTIEMRSQADTSKFTTASMTVAANVTVNVSPGTSTLPTNGTQQFVASVVGTVNQAVTWSVNGIPGGNATVGTIDGSGLYTAPASAPAGAVTVTATSVDDPLQSASGTLTVAAGAFISKISPASITALTVSSTDFAIRVQGLLFAASSPGPGSTIIFNGNNLTTNCGTGTTLCTATIPASSVTNPGDYGVQIRNPDNSVSNQVALKVLDATSQSRDINDASVPVVTLTTASPDATGQDIQVVEPTTAGSQNEHYNIDQVGVVTGNSCSLTGTGVILTRPQASTQDFDIGVGSTIVGAPSLLPTDTFTISGPSPNDITILSVTSIGAPGCTIKITLRVGSTSQLGPRTIFVENKNREKAALVGGIEVK